MNIQHLKYAIEVEKTGSITQAADNLFMGQPNLSKAIKELESSIGINIFKRTAKGVIPTQKGKEYLDYAKSIIEQIDEMDRLFSADGGIKAGLNICVPRASYITEAFTDFLLNQDTEKSLEMNFKETNTMQAISEVCDGVFDMAVIRYQSDFENYFLNLIAEKGLEAEPVWEFTYLALMSKNHPLAKKKNIKAEELYKYIEITHGDIKVPISSKKIKPISFPKRRILVYERGSQFDILSKINTTYMWVSPIPENLLAKNALVQKKCSSDSRKYKDIIIYQKGYTKTEYDKAFIDELMKQRDKMMGQIK